MEVNCQLHAPFVLLSPLTHWIGRWVGPRAGLERLAVDIKILPLHGIESHPFSSQPVILLTELTKSYLRPRNYA